MHKINLDSRSATLPQEIKLGIRSQGHHYKHDVRVERLVKFWARKQNKG